LLSLSSQYTKVKVYLTKNGKEIMEGNSAQCLFNYDCEQYEIDMFCIESGYLELHVTRTIELHTCPYCESEDIKLEDYEDIHEQQRIDDALDRMFDEERGK
ncbi:MAG: hypothetical protein RR766_08325, partial [Longicatena sp.]